MMDSLLRVIPLHTMEIISRHRRMMSLLIWTLLLLSGYQIKTGAALDITDCRLSLGMQSMEIPDEAITASSSYDPESVGASNARIRTEVNGGAWCPKDPITRDVYEYLQVDLGTLMVITLVETQGRFGNGQGQEYADQYLLEYQREDGGSWFRFRNRRGQEIFQGNTNTYIAELREIDPPIIARKIRFIPYSEHPKTVCMRVELYGCRWLDGLVSYDMHQGERRGTEVDLLDFTYDGRIQNDYLSGGLGQLTDGEMGQANFRLDGKGMGIKGYEWVGWRNETHHPKHIEMIFKFDTVRNFSRVNFHANNLFSKDVRVFKSVRMYFSIGGEHYLGHDLYYRHMRDTLIEFARPVLVQMENRIGRYVKMVFEFDSKWMMMSEVEFTSEPAVGNFTPEVIPTKPPENVNPIIIDVVPDRGSAAGGKQIPTYDTNPDDTFAATIRSPAQVTPPGVTPQAVEGASKNNKSTPDDDGEDSSGGRRAGANLEGGSQSKGAATSSEDVIDTERERKSLDDEYIGIIIGALSALILLLFVVILIIIWRQRRKKFNNNHRVMKSVGPRRVTLDLNDLQTATLTSNGKLSNGNMYNCVSNSDNEIYPGEKVDIYGNHPDTIQHRKLPDLPNGTMRSTDTNMSRDYAIPDVTKSSVGMVPNIPIQPTAPPLYGTYGRLPQPVTAAPAAPPSHYAASDIIPNIQGVSGNNVYAAPNPDLLWTEDFSVMELPRENLKFLEKLGEGQFGEVHLCEAHNITDFLGDDFLVNRTGNSPSLLVAVKMLRSDADHPARVDFQKEVKIMAQLKDPNVVRVLGVCTQEEPFCVIVEYMKFGDLHQFMQLHTLENTMTKKRRGSNLREVSYGCLIYMSTQIASGMKYLESLNMVHRDLATRNCLVGNYYTIKISDFGMSRSLYSGDYYRIEGRAVLPIRWMAWESILLGKFSTKSDVWSFGVTLWEILSFAREQPYDNLSDEQVIENCGHYYRNDGLETYLPQPANCPREIYDLIRECWNRDEVQRPSFREIHMFMQRKNMGYDPKIEKTYAPLV